MLRLVSVRRMTDYFGEHIAQENLQTEPVRGMLMSSIFIGTVRVRVLGSVLQSGTNSSGYFSRSAAVGAMMFGEVGAKLVLFNL